VISFTSSFVKLLTLLNSDEILELLAIYLEKAKTPRTLRIVLIFVSVPCMV
jgi:hypothetical protein